MGIHHVSLSVASLQDAKKFYLDALAPLGYTEILSFEPHAVGLGGPNGQPDFWLGAAKEGAVPTTGAHIAFAAENHEQVNAFHAAALKAGATDNGKPGLRPHYTPTYYAAFVLDPHGNNIEVVNLPMSAECQGLNKQ